eukprot:359094-Chlamydomonas_euryale.AAC.24
MPADPHSRISASPAPLHMPTEGGIAVSDIQQAMLSTAYHLRMGPYLTCSRRHGLAQGPAATSQRWQHQHYAISVSHVHTKSILSRLPAHLLHAFHDAGDDGGRFRERNSAVDLSARQASRFRVEGSWAGGGLNSRGGRGGRFRKGVGRKCLGAWTTSHITQLPLKPAF